MTGRGKGSVTTRSAPTAARRTRPRAAAGCRVERAWFSSAGSCSTASTTVSAARRTAPHRRRARVCRRPRILRPARSSRERRASPGRCARSRPASSPGLRTCTSVSSHSSVTSSRPSPFTSMTAAFEHDALAGVGARRLSRAAVLSAARSRCRPSRRCCQLEYFAHPLNAQFTQDHVAGVVDDAGRGRVAKPDAIGLDLVEAYAIACGRRARRVPRARRPSRPAVWQRISTRSWSASTRTISA